MSDQSSAQTPNEVSMEVLHKEVNDIKEKITDMDRDLAGDRKDIGNMRVKMASIEQKQTEISDEISRYQTKVQDAVHYAVEAEIAPMRKQMNQMQETLNGFVNDKKKIIYFNPPHFQFLQKLKFW